MKRFAIIYGALKTELQKRAVEELTSILLDYTKEYPICISSEEKFDVSDHRCIYIGTKETNPYIRKVSKATLTEHEEYLIKIENNTVFVEGYDDAGVLYGVLDLYNQYITKYEHPNDDRYWVNFLIEDELPDFEYTSSPSVKERGLWTWGHVIYDYRGYLDHMMKLKMNSVIIWNDFVPANAKEIVAYAHARNIKVIWGFAWLWDTDCKRVDLKHLDGFAEDIFKKYEEEYANVGGDGIYFQTFTELHRDHIDGVCIAEAAASFVNHTASLFYAKYPNMDLQFGLHATSVKNKLEFIQTVDKRIRIVWEDCGSFPFSYIPSDVKDFEKTKEFIQKTAFLRGTNERFGVVTKGLVKLDWSQFEHQKAPSCIGVSSKAMKKDRIDRKKRIWRYIQAEWLIHADKAYEMVQEMYRLKDGELCVFALVEDGMFEENIMYPVALFAEMLWNCHTDMETLTRNVALRSYVDFA